ncbi:MAG: acyclic terpene utilization AtuA family protein [Candidatus Nanopelagicales bacterium]
MSQPDPSRAIRIANCSGFFGDRISAAREMVDGGPIDVLTGDWLAELTMLILAKQRMRQGEDAGWASTFGIQMKDVLADCLAKGIKVVSNAGGINPAGAAAALRKLADEQGLDLTIAYVEGDNITDRLDEIHEESQGSDSPENWTNIDTGEELAEVGLKPLTANVYVGARGVAEALAAGADVVITGRVTDAALIIGPAAWWHGWSFDEALAGDQTQLDALAGALVAGHVIECGCQATGGNYSFFEDVPSLNHPGFPIAEIESDGAAVITKHEGTDGLVSVGTVTCQLLYEIGGPDYLNPDVSAKFDTIKLEQVGPDRVRISDTVGILPPPKLKVGINMLGGFRNTVSLVLTGLQQDEKANIALNAVCGISLEQAESGATPSELAELSSLDVTELDIQLLRTFQTNPITLAEAQSFLNITVKDPNPKKVGRAFSSKVIEATLSSYPGLFPTRPPAEGSPYGVFWPALVDPKYVTVTVNIEGQDPIVVSPGGRPDQAAVTAEPDSPTRQVDTTEFTYEAPSEVSIGLVPFGDIVGARSGDKGGNANVGFWVPDIGDGNHELRFAWLVNWLTPSRVHHLLPEAEGLKVDVYPLPNLNSVNVVIYGLLDRGVAQTTRIDPQAKGLGEQFRARLIRIPADLIPESSLPLDQGVT